MALFHSNRYWPDNDGESGDGSQATQPAPALSLERLHQLARERAARRKRASLCNDEDKQNVDLARPTDSHKKKKRKKTSIKKESKSGSEEVDSECKVTLNDAEEELKELKLTDVPTSEGHSKSRKRKRRGKDGDPSSHLLTDVSDALTVTDKREMVGAWMKLETNVVKKKMKRKTKRKKHSEGDDDDGCDDTVATVEPTCDDSPLDKSHQDVDRQSDQEDSDYAELNVSLSYLSSSGEQEDSSQVDTREEKNGDSESEIVAESNDTMQLPLVPLGYKERDKAAVKEKRTVQRQLPQWITEADIISDDIIEQSRSVDEFSLPELLVRNLARVHIDKLFPVQAAVIPDIISCQSGPLFTSLHGLPPRDLSVCAPTGCGKTLCYVVPIVSALLNRAVCQVRALVVVPSQELAIQVQTVFDQLAHGTPILVGVICGAVSFERERAMLMDSATFPPCSCLDIVIATPGRLVEHLDKKSFSTLRHLRYLVIDEADKLLGHHFNEWLPKILSAVETDKVAERRGTVRGNPLSMSGLSNTLLGLCASPERLQLMTEEERHVEENSGVEVGNFSDPYKQFPLLPTASTSPLQKLLFSATMTMNPEHLAALNLHRPKLFTVAKAVQGGGRGRGDGETAFTLPKHLVECTVKCSLEHKPVVLIQLLTTEERRTDMTRVLCFTNSKESTHRLYLLLDAFKLTTVGEISSSLGKGKRKSILDSFRTGKTQVLVCSDQMARGMDMEGVTCVVNYDSPRQYQTYLHRAGRTARAGQRGMVFTLLSREEVHPFNTMLRKNGVNVAKQLQDVAVPSSLLKPLLSQYQSALDQLKQQLQRTGSSKSHA